MVLFTTLKANKEHGIDELDIVIAYEETYGCVADLFREEGSYYCDNWDTDTNLDLLLEDYTARQIASRCLKALKNDAKDKEMGLLNWTTQKVFIDIDAPEIAFMQVEDLIEMGVITGSNELRDLERKARKRGCTIKKEVCYDEVNHYYCMKYVDDIIEEKFPCYADVNDTYCNNCGNCQ